MLITDVPSLVGLDDSASSLSRCTNASVNLSHARPNTPGYRQVKRRKITGLNTRFDRMIESVNATLSYGSSSPTVSRKRTQFSATSSVSSHDVPKTPVNVYSSIQPGKLGTDFSVLKMKKSPLHPREDSGGCIKLAAPSKEPRNPLPDWLADTFCSLEADHPLRGLLSPSRLNTESPVQLPGVSHEEEIFAFSPFEFDKQEEVPNTAYLVGSILDVQGNVSSVVPTEPTLSHIQPVASTNILPFSTPGFFAPTRRSIESSISQQRTLAQAPPQQVTSHATNMMHPPAVPPSRLRLDDTIELPQFTRAFSNLVQDDDHPSDFDEHGAFIRHNHQVFRGGHDNLNVYTTPGPTFACSLPVYFDSPTEDPSLSDPLQPESYGLDLNSIDFRWRPFLRSHAQESETNRRSVSSSPQFGYAIPNQVGDQYGLNPRFIADQGEYCASSEELPSLAEDVETVHLDNVGAIPPNNVDASTITNLIRPWLSPINEAQQVRPMFAIAPGVLLSPLRDQFESALLAADSIMPRVDGEIIHTSEELALLPSRLHGREMRLFSESEAREIRPSTPIKQVPLPVSPPSAPQKVRPSQLSGTPRASVHKTSSALSWMMPLKFSKRAIAAHDDVNCRLSRVSANSHDSIESWNGAS